jgi:mannose-6-phosphate isomerase-like protein (cupin superfamily)
MAPDVPVAIDLRAKLARFPEPWTPRVVAELNDYQVKVVKLAGDFVWHRHDDTDELFLVLHGEMEVGFRDRSVAVREGELFVVPRGVEHITRARTECHALIIEPPGVPNTGDAGGSRTAPQDAWI